MRSWLIVAALVCAPVLALDSELSGSYDDCIINSMQSVQSDTAAIEIKKACRNKFPKVERPVQSISAEDLEKIRTTATMKRIPSFGAPTYMVTYHNSTERVISDLTVAIETKGGRLDFKKVMRVMPDTAGSTLIEIREDQLPTGQLRWFIKSGSYTD
jgi:hypothetical protein